MFTRLDSFFAFFWLHIDMNTKPMRFRNKVGNDPFHQNFDKERETFLGDLTTLFLTIMHILPPNSNYHFIFISFVILLLMMILIRFLYSF